MSTIATSRPKKFLTRTLFGVVVGGVAYDGFNEFKVYGGGVRFLRSLGIAALISFDYSWNLYGIAEDTDQYERVSDNVIAKSSH